LRSQDPEEAARRGKGNLAGFACESNHQKIIKLNNDRVEATYSHHPADGLG